MPAIKLEVACFPIQSVDQLEQSSSVACTVWEGGLGV